MPECKRHQIVHNATDQLEGDTTPTQSRLLLGPEVPVDSVEEGFGQLPFGPFSPLDAPVSLELADTATSDGIIDVNNYSSDSMNSSNEQDWTSYMDDTLWERTFLEDVEWIEKVSSTTDDPSTATPEPLQAFSSPCEEPAVQTERGNPFKILNSQAMWRERVNHRWC
jgi:hypothetical protein